MTLSRRQFGQHIGQQTLGGMLLLALGGGIAGCGATSAALTTLLLEKTIPPRLVQRFRQQTGYRIHTELGTGPQALWQQIAQWSAPSDRPLVGSLGDYWLPEAIARGKLQPIEVQGLSHWGALATPWQNLVKRDGQGQTNASGAIWGIPYRWGNTVLVYRQDKLAEMGWELSDWGDLWRSEVRQRFSLLNQPREVIGLVLKKLGHSYNSANLEAIADLKPALEELHRGVKFYGDEQYLQPLILGETWIAQAWSHDALPLVKRYPNINAILPLSGTSLWADLWVQPAQQQMNEVLQAWWDFWLDGEVAQTLSLESVAASPVLWSWKPQDLPLLIQTNPMLWLPPEQQRRSEFLAPLSPETQGQYDRLWSAIGRLTI